MSSHVLLNLLNKLGKSNKMLGSPSILSLFHNESNIFNNAGARMLDSTYISWHWNYFKSYFNMKTLGFAICVPGRVAQSVTCLATDACLTADPGVASSIPARYHTFSEIDHKIISTVILPLPLIYSRRVVVSYKRKYVHELLVNRLLKPAQEKVWLSELTVPQLP